MRTYIAFYGRTQVEVQAVSSYAAQQEAARLLKVPEKHRYKISVHLADVVHTATE